MAKRKNEILLNMPAEDFGDAATRIVEEIKKQLPEMGEVVALKGELEGMKAEMEYTLPIIQDHRKMVVAMKNAMAIAETLEHHGKVFEEMDERLTRLTNLFQTTQNKLITLESMIQAALSMKFGTGPTTPGQ